MWPFSGERYPYANTHELNLDWIIKIIKEVSDTYPGRFENLEQEIAKKMNLAINAGSIGDILVNAGNNKTEWKPFDDAIAGQIIEAVNLWLDDHPEATTTVQDGSITLQKLNDSLKSFFTAPRIYGVSTQEKYNKYDIMGVYGASAYAMQGAEYNPTRNRFVFCFAASTSDPTLTPVIIETDDNMQFIRAKEQPNAGHFNDITYNAAEDKYYACTMEATAQILVIDGTTLEELDLIQPSILGTLTMLSYDSTNNVYYGYSSVGANDYLYRFNADFSSAEMIFTNVYNAATINTYNDNIRFLYKQGSTLVNGHLVMVFWFGFEHDPAITRLVVLNESNTAVQAFIDFENINNDDEAETAILINNKILVTSYYDNKIIISTLPLNNKPVNITDIITTRLSQHTYNSQVDPELLDNMGVQTGAGETYKYWINFSNNPPDMLGERGKLEGGFYNNYGWQTLIEPTHYYFRKLNNGSWLPFHDILILATETTTNILTEALTNSSGGVKYLRYTGTDYSWLPFNDPNFRYALFKIDYCFSQRIVSVIDVSGRLICTNMYINNTWTGWIVEGTYSTTQNVLTLISNINRGHISIRYTGQDTSWLPNTNNKYVYGIFEITIISSNIIKVDAYAFDGTSHAVNMYVNNAWQGWHIFNPA